MDLNPYLNKKLDEPLPRFLSYEIDSMTAPTAFVPQGQNVQIITHSHGHMMRRDDFLDEKFLESVRMRNTQGLSEDKIKKLRQVILAKVWKEEDLINLVSPNNISSLSSLQPFIYEVYQEYTRIFESGDHTSPPPFMDFLMNHEMVCRRESQHVITIPLYSAKYGNMRAQRCQKVNEYKQCIDAHSADTPCENIEDKKVFVDYLL